MRICYHINKVGGRLGHTASKAASAVAIQSAFGRNMLVVVLSVLVFPMMAQVKRVNNCNPMSRTQAPYSEIIYEYDNDDTNRDNTADSVSVVGEQ